jgi:Fe2+ transport system protein B
MDPGVVVEESVATKAQAEEFLAKRKDMEEYYKTLIDAHKYEHEYVKMISEMSEFELRNRMAIIKMAQMDAQMKEAQAQEKVSATTETPIRKLKPDA